jgi:hypothetical protein
MINVIERLEFLALWKRFISQNQISKLNLKIKSQNQISKLNLKIKSQN